MTLCTLFLVALFSGAPHKAWAAQGRHMTLIREGDLRLNEGEAASALESYSKAAEEARRRGDLPGEAQAVNNLGAAYLALGQDGRARALFKKASEIGWAAGRTVSSGAEETNLLANGGFEGGLLLPWGTGHYETRGGKFRFGIWWNSRNARSFFKVDTSQRRSGLQSLQIRNYSKPEPHVFGTTSQRITGLPPNTAYRLTLWAKAKDLEGGAVSFTIDPGWNQRPINLPKGNYDWKRFTATFCIGPLTFIDFRIIHQAPGTVWLDDISITRLPSGARESDAQGSLASCNLASGRYQAALDHYTKMLEASGGEGKRSARGRIHYAIGRVQFRLGYYARALDSFGKASELARVPTDIDLGDLYVELGDYDEAEKNLQAALKRVWGDQATRSRVFKRLGALASVRGRQDEALDYFGKALRIQRHIGDRASAAETLLEIGQLHQRVGNLEEAKKAYVQALATSRTIQNRQLEADLETGLAFLSLEAKKLDEARGKFQNAVKLQRSLRGRRGLVLALFGSGRTLEALGDLKGAEHEYKEAVQLLESIRLAFPSESPLREKFLEVNQRVYARLIGVLIQGDKGDEALEYLERSRSKTLRDQFSQMDIAFRDEEQKSSLEQERALAARRQAQEARLATENAKPSGKRNAAVIKDLEKSLSVTTEEYRNFLYELFRKYPDLRYHVSVDPKDLKRQRTSLPKDLALVEYIMGEDELYCFVLTSQEVKAKVVPVSRSSLEGKIAYLLSLAGNASLARSAGPINPDTMTPQGVPHSPSGPKLLTSFRKASSELYGFLIKPIEADISGKNTVGIAPDGRLATFPFQILGTSRGGRFHWLLEDHALFYFHSLDFLRTPKAQGGAGPGAPHLTAFGNADGSLPHAEAEVMSLKALDPAADIYLGREATEDRVKSKTGETAKLHLATHGVLDYTDIRKSFLTFAPDPAAAEDGRLTLGEVWALPLDHVRLVTLSACQTAVGEASAGTGLVNPATAFLDAGAQSVVASLWMVNDEATSKLVRSFYGELNKTSTAEALRQAQLALARDPRYAFPYYWGAFILLGGWL